MVLLMSDDEIKRVFVVDIDRRVKSMNIAEILSCMNIAPQHAEIYFHRTKPHCYLWSVRTYLQHRKWYAIEVLS